MSLILQIETATTSCSVALASNASVLAVKELNARNIHAEVITLYIEEVMAAAGKKLGELDAVAVSCGPGSYTGLRIGVSTAKGLCFALDKPLIAVNTLAAMAKGFIDQQRGNVDDGLLLCPMIDARRMEVFTAVYDGSGNEVKPTSAEIIDENSFSDLLDKSRMIFFGDGAGKCREALGSNPNAVIVDDFINSAVYLTKPALQKFQDKQFEDVAYFEPFYLKDFIAGKKAS
jgi:tRNA threonylcarbamoyladenosine biosynthesis protein TsaB